MTTSSSPTFWQARLGDIPVDREPVPVLTFDGGRSQANGFHSERFITFIGDWQTGGYIFDRVQRTEREFAAFEFVFAGPVIRWIGSRGPDFGRADVLLDGELVETIDAYASEPEAEVVKFERRDLDPGVPHKLRVVARRSKNPAATGSAQDLQRLEAVRPICYPIEIAEARGAEYAVIQAKGKAVPDPSTWTPVPDRASAPRSGVTLAPGVLRTAFDRNLEYLRHCLQSATFCDGVGWTDWLPASNEGRMLAGLANILRWEEHDDVRDGMLGIVAGAVDRARPDGYHNLYSDEAYRLEWGMDSERKNYDRVFFTRGLLAAAEAGAPGAADAVRGLYDWFNQGPWLPKMLLGSNATNGLPGGPLVHLSPVGVPDDLATTIRYYDQDYWIDELSRAEPLAFTYYPGERPHCYSLLGLEAFGNEYRATGDRRYLDAVRGGWKAYRENFQHVGGITTLMEIDAICPPKAYEINRYLFGELCGSVFWITINEILQSLDPTTEAYAGDIEESVLNSVFGAQDRAGYLRYHAALTGEKEVPKCVSTCCEVTGTDLMARLPELIYATGDDGVFVHQFFASTLVVSDGDGARTIELASDFPVSGAVAITVRGAASTFALNVRVPAWSPGPVEFVVGGERVATGTPGSYARIERRWEDGDVLTFDLAPTLRISRYEGLDQVAGAERGALLFGPVLLAITGHDGEAPRLPFGIDDLAGQVERVRPDALEFAVTGQPGLRFLPYSEIQEGVLEVYPVFEVGTARTT